MKAGNKIYAAMLMLAALAFVGIGIGRLYAPSYQTPSQKMSAIQGMDMLHQPMPEKEMTLRFLDAEHWKAEVPTTKTVGFAQIGARSCEIVLPAADFAIDAQPKLGIASWQNDQAGRTLAHEILHCAIGEWHPAWDQIEQNRKISRNDALQGTVSIWTASHEPHVQIGFASSPNYDSFQMADEHGTIISIDNGHVTVPDAATPTEAARRFVAALRAIEAPQVGPP